MVAGPVEQQEAMVMNPTGHPASAPIRAASRLPLSWARGEMVHSMMDRRGRLRRASRPPARTEAISTAARASLSGIDAFRLDMLGGIAPDGQELVKPPGFGRAVLGGDGDPMEGHFLQVVGDSRDVRDVPDRRPPLQARRDVDHLDAAAVRADIDVVSVQGKVLGGVPGGQSEGGRRAAQGGFEEGRGNFDDLRPAVHPGAMSLPDVQGPRGRELHADGFDDLQGGFMDPADVLGTGGP